jgi:Condensation domain
VPTPTVHFTGGRSGACASTWGQYFIWAEMQVAAPDHERFNIAIESSCERGLALDALVAAMRRALAVHESLRTKLRRTPHGELQQILHSDMRLPIHIVEACDAATVRRYKEALRERLLRKPFDFAGEWPIRVGAISRDGLIRYVLIVVSHHAIDHRAIPLLEKTLWHDAPIGRQGLQPLDEAAYQASLEGQRVTAAAEDYWRRTLRHAPLKMFRNKSADPRTPRYWMATLTSWALPLAAQVVSRDMRVGPSAVLLAALSATISEMVGTDRCVFLVQVHNRFRAALCEAVSSVTMEGLFLVEAGGVPFREIVRRSWAAALDTYQYAYHDRRRVDAVISEVERERGSRIDLSCWVNDMRSTNAGPQQSELTVEGIVRKLGLTELEWSDKYERHNNVTFGLRAYGSREVIKLELIADTHALTPAQMEHVLRQIETIVVGEVVGH